MGAYIVPAVAGTDTLAVVAEDNIGRAVAPVSVVVYIAPSVVVDTVYIAPAVALVAVDTVYIAPSAAVAAGADSVGIVT